MQKMNAFKINIHLQQSATFINWRLNISRKQMK